MTPYTLLQHLRALPVVGSSTTGKGHVCKGHNEAEWGEALRKYDPPMSRNLLRDSARSLRAGGQS
jgi:hypothetical protein